MEDKKEDKEEQEEKLPTDTKDDLESQPEKKNSVDEPEPMDETAKEALETIEKMTEGMEEEETLEKEEKKDIIEAEEKIEEAEEKLEEEEKELEVEEKKEEEIEKEIQVAKEEIENTDKELKKAKSEKTDALEEEEFKDLKKDVKPAPKPILEAVEPDEPTEASVKVEKANTDEMTTHIFGLRTTANREDQVMSFLSSNVVRKKIAVHSIVRPHGMRGYIFLEAEKIEDAEQAAFGVPYARGVLPKEIQYNEIEHMLERVKKDINIQKNDIAEIISGPFKREKAKITRVDKAKEEVVVELLEAAVPIPITVKIDAVKVIRRDTDE
ncbi:MAG: transcription elongation factor Spt5 [Nanoarchaeota archaeon]|nr:transcription elongation factor Spt5 [Nanoarchaeota archaeon]